MLGEDGRTFLLSQHSLRFLVFLQIVGIITRHNLTHEFLLAKLRQHHIRV